MIDINAIPISSWIELVLAAFLIGFSKAGVPGAGILTVVLMAMAVPAKASTGLLLPLLIFGDFIAVAYYREHVVWRHLFALIPYAFIGVVIGYFGLSYVNDAQLRPIIGIITLVMLVLSMWRDYNLGKDASPPKGWYVAPAFGMTGGATTMMANAAGPVMIIYLLAMRLPKNEFISTGAWYFLVVNLFKVPFSANLNLINPSSLTINLLLAPCVLLGAFAGRSTAKRLSENTFKIIVQILTAAGGIKLIF